MNMMLNFGHELVVDNFAGGGGASEGIEQALGRPVDLAINHDETAIAVHTENHPDSEHAVADVWDIDPEKATRGQPVGLAWFSPDCRHHSKAKGGRPVSKSVRGLAWVAARWAARVKPRVIVIENVEEFVDWGPLLKGADGKTKPDPARKGQTFRGFVRALNRHGYRVEWRTLRACDFGAPTIRKRFFLIARRDGLPIRWPKPTHGEPKAPAVQRGKLKPYRTAAECIDWAIPCPSIFGRAKPLADNTLRRIAKGVMRYVVDSGDPFIVKCNHTASWYDAFRGQSLRQPFQTLTTAPGFAVVAPHITKFRTGAVGHRCDEPMHTITANANVTRPGVNPGGCAPIGMVSAFLAKHFTGVVGDDLRRPVPTITATDHNALVAASMVNLKGSERGGRDIQEPMSTVCAGGTHAAAVAAFMVKYYGQGIGQTMDEAFHTIPTRDRFGLVTVSIKGEQYVITDIGMRMLQPHELAMAQGFPESYRLDQVGGKAVPKYQQVRLIGNSVCPPLAKAIVEANFTHEQKLNPALAEAAA